MNEKSQNKSQCVPQKKKKNKQTRHKKQATIQRNYKSSKISRYLCRSNIVAATREVGIDGHAVQPEVQQVRD